MTRRFVSLFAFAAVLTAAACTDIPAAPSEDTTPGVPCSQPAPEPGMVCRGDTWSWS